MGDLGGTRIEVDEIQWCEDGRIQQDTREEALEDFTVTYLAGSFPNTMDAEERFEFILNQRIFPLIEDRNELRECP